MKKNTVTSTFIYEIESGDEFLQVVFDCELHQENDGIGSYEFWGSSGYDEGTDYLVLDDMKWNKGQFTDEQNKIIEKYVDDNWVALEETITQELYDNCDDEYYYED